MVLNGGYYPGEKKKKPCTLGAWYLCTYVPSGGSEVMVWFWWWARVVEWVVRTHFFEIAKRLRHSFPRKHEEVFLPCKYRPSQTVFPNLTNWGDKRGPFCDPTQTCLTVLASHKAFDAFHFQSELPRSSMISRKGTMPMFRCAFPTQYQARQFGRLAMIPKSPNP